MSARVSPRLAGWLANSPEQLPQLGIELFDGQTLRPHFLATHIHVELSGHAILPCHADWTSPSSEADPTPRRRKARSLHERQASSNPLMTPSRALTINCACIEQKPPIQLDTLKQETFSHGVRKKTKKEIEKENEERKRIEEEKYVAKGPAYT